MTRRTDLGRGDAVKAASDLIQKWMDERAFFLSATDFLDLEDRITAAINEAETRGRRSCGALSAEDSKALMDMLDNPPPPSPKLVELMRGLLGEEPTESDVDDDLFVRLIAMPTTRRRRVLDRVRVAMGEETVEGMR